MERKPFNLSKQARRDPPTAFDLTSPDRFDPYRINKGKPGSNDPSDKLRENSQPSAFNPTPGGGAAQFDNKEWPSDKSILTDNEGRPQHDNGPGLVTDHGIDMHDGVEPMQDDAVLGKNETVTRQLDDNHRDRVPYNVNSNLGVLRSVRNRLRSL